MKHSLILVFLISHWAIAATRNPFQPPENPCQHPWHNWRYQGVVQQNTVRRALIQTSENQWQRLSQGETLATGGTVLSVTLKTVTLSAASECPAVTLQLSHKEAQHVLATPAHSVAITPRGNR